MRDRLSIQLMARVALAALFILVLMPLGAQSLVNDAGFGATVSAGVPGGVFGPITYARTQGPPDTYQDQFFVPAANSYNLWIKNGDTNEDGDPGHRVSSATIVINGVTVVTPTEFNQTVDFIQKPVALPYGTSTITAQINGQPGSFITVAIFGAPGGDMTVGRVLTPWVINPDAHATETYSEGGAVRFALKNGSVHHARAVQALFFNPDGSVACRSPRLMLRPRGSANVDLGHLLGDCTAFTAGSVEFYWSGHGPARVFGTVTRILGNGEISALQLHMAGWHRRRMQPPPPAATAPETESVTAPARLDLQRKSR